MKDALIYIAGRKKIHGDIKPGNILVSNRDRRLRAFVGDFGLTGKSGGTSMFIAPEGLDKNFRIIEKTDLYSFAITVLLLIFPEELALALLFLPTSEDFKAFRQSQNRFPLLELIFESLRCDPGERIALRNWSMFFKSMKNFDENMLVKKIASEQKDLSWNDYFKKYLRTKGVVLDPLDKAVMSEGFEEMKLSQVNKKGQLLTKAVSYMQKLSSIYCDSKFSQLSKGLILDEHIR